MTFRIPAGKHYARPWRFDLWWLRTAFKWKVKLTESCRYDLKSADQLDTNKLIGIGYLLRHHTDSARFGWRYDGASGQIELLAYCYVSGRRSIKPLCFVEIGKEYDLYLKVLSTCYYFEVKERGGLAVLGFQWIDHFHNKRLKYGLWPYFGGDQVAPHEMKIQIERA